MTEMIDGLTLNELRDSARACLGSECDHRCTQILALLDALEDARGENLRLAGAEQDRDQLQAALDKANEWVPHVGARIAYDEMEAENEKLKARLHKTCGCSWDGDKEYHECADHAAMRAERARLQGEAERLRESLGIRDKVLRYVLFTLRGNETVNSDLCDEVQMAADETQARVRELEGALESLYKAGDVLCGEASQMTVSVPHKITKQAEVLSDAVKAFRAACMARNTPTRNEASDE